MATRTYCDRCSVEFIHTPPEGIGLVNYNIEGAFPDLVDLCPSCLADLENFMKEKPNQPQ